MLTMYHRIRPKSTIPICLDLGTNNPKNLADPFYLGLRRKRSTDEEMTEFMEEFMREMSLAFPQLLVQFEVRNSFLLMFVYSLPLLYSSLGLFHRTCVYISRYVPS